MGLHLEEAKHALLRRGNYITVRFSNGIRNLELPGQIAWSAPGPRDPFDVGVQFRLELAGATMREAYAIWVVKAIHTAQQGSLTQTYEKQFHQPDETSWPPTRLP